MEDGVHVKVRLGRPEARSCDGFRFRVRIAYRSPCCRPAVCLDTSASQVRGSSSSSVAVPTRVLYIAATRAPDRSEPRNSRELRSGTTPLSQMSCRMARIAERLFIALRRRRTDTVVPRLAAGPGSGRPAAALTAADSILLPPPSSALLADPGSLPNGRIYRNLGLDTLFPARVSQSLHSPSRRVGE